MMRNCTPSKVFPLVVFLGMSSFTAQVFAASFDCTKARTNVEKLVCQDQELSKLDEKLNKVYFYALSQSADPKVTRDTQRYWLKSQRDVCKDKFCLVHSYDYRIQELTREASLQSIDVKEPPCPKIKHTAVYTLVMSKNDQLCQSVMKLYNTNKTDELFSTISWKKLDFIPPYSSTIGKRALFDINNDGKKELVIKMQEWLHNVSIDRLQIFPGDSDTLKKLESITVNDWSTLGNAENIVFKGNGVYQLADVKALSKFYGTNNIVFRNYMNLNQTPKNKDVSGETWCPSPSIGNSIALNPFVFSNSAYLSITDADSYGEADANAEWIVIAKYLYQDKVQEMCYLRK